MKTLEQLGISPTPWTKAGDIVDDNEGRVIFNAYEDDDYANACLIAAAPELYEALYDVVAYCESTHLVPSERFGKVLAKVKAALAKASGESEVKE